MLRFAPPPTAERVQGTRGGELSHWYTAPDVFVTQASGHMDRRMVMGYTTAAERFLGEGGRLYMFHHWLAIDGYSPDAREWLTQWAMQWAPQLPGSHFLLHSRMVAMAVSVAALILRRTLHSYTDEAEFLATLEATRRGAPDRIRED